MNFRYSEYTSYKDTNIGWIGSIPDHWVVSKVKFLAPFQVGWTPPTGNDDNFVGDNLWANISDLKSKVIYETAKKISDHAADVASMEITPQGSLLYSFKLSVGAVSFAGIDMYTNEAIASFLSDGKLPLSYLYYVLPIFVIENASTNIYGAKILNQELIRSALLLAPPYKEAEQIANFLDHETAKIDTLIEKQQQLIKLLKEKRQAVISHAVTKGLNPDVPMKDSGIEWLGEVPEHWVAPKIGYKCDVTKLTGFEYTNHWKPDAHGEIVALRGFNIGERLLQLHKTEKITKKLSDKLFRSKLNSGDIVMPCTGTLGNAAVIDEDDTYHINQNIAKLTFVSDIDSSFASYWLTSTPFRTLIDFNNTSGMQPVLLIGDIRNMPFPLPDIKEQKQIVSYLQRVTYKLEKVINKSELSLRLFLERRTSLISAAVTGKIDVRNWQPENQTAQATAS